MSVAFVPVFLESAGWFFARGREEGPGGVKERFRLDTFYAMYCAYAML